MDQLQLSYSGKPKALVSPSGIYSFLNPDEMYNAGSFLTQVMWPATQLTYYPYFTSVAEPDFCRIFAYQQPYVVAYLSL